jgi:hypothetical protein
LRWCYVGIADDRRPHPWSPCPRQVDHIFTVSVTTLLAPGAARRETWDFGGRRVPIDHFPVNDQVIRGATHRITRNVLDIIVEGFH